MAPSKTQSLRLTDPPELLREKFLALRTLEDVARLLEVDRQALIYYLWRMPEKARYHTFQVPKKSPGKHRTISAPATPLKVIQRKLNQVLQVVYEPRASTQGFVQKRGIRSNALGHVGREYVLNVDLENFFPSINFGRVRGLLMAVPYQLPERVATVLAQICCHANVLPQGAPTSPTVANMICAKLDSQLQRLAKRHKCYYSRYADDITISPYKGKLPTTFARIQELPSHVEVVIGKPFRDVIEGNGFNINPSKVRARRYDRRQEVTGLTVNLFPNVERRFVKRLRCMLHAWEKFGYEAAEIEFHAKYATRKHRKPGTEPPSYRMAIKGHLDFLQMVRGEADPLYRKLLLRYGRLFKDFKEPPTVHDAVWVLEAVLEEGKPYRQGTAFMLEGYGLVTCIHCVVEGAMVAFKAEEHEVRYPVKLVRAFPKSDLAILQFSEVEMRRPHTLAASQSSLPRPGDPVRVLGFPNWAPGQTIQQTDGHVTGMRRFFDDPSVQVSQVLYYGNSGGPALNSRDEVIGIVRSGWTEKEIGESGIIPIEVLRKRVAGFLDVTGLTSLTLDESS